MRGRLGLIVVAAVAAFALSAPGASAAPMNVTMTPTSGPTGTTVNASSNDTCPAMPAPRAPDNQQDGPLVIWQARLASEPAPAAGDENWEYVVAEDNFVERGDSPWSGHFKVGEATGEAAKASGAYTIYFSCGYSEWPPPTQGLPRTDGPPTAYGDYTPKAFQVCQTGTQTCTSTAGATSTTSTTVATTSTTAATAATTTTTTTTTVASGPAASTRPGATVDVTATGYRPNSTGTIDFESTPVRVGTFTANASGNVAAAVKIPSNATAGVHHIVLTGVDAAGATRTLRVQVNVAGAIIARTGSANTLWLLAAFTLGAIGVLLRGVAGDRRARGAHLIRR